MKWNLVEAESTDKRRLYLQETTGMQLTTEVLITDKMGNKWWGFSDLFKVPYIRIAFARQISELFTTGMSVNDILNWCAKEKEILKTARANPKAEPEAYEKLYSLILEKEALVKNTVDPMQQHLALATVYVLEDKERIDFFDMTQATKKIELWKFDQEAQTFFLNWHTSHILNFTEAYKGFAQIVLNSQQQANKEG